MEKDEITKEEPATSLQEKNADMKKKTIAEKLESNKYAHEIYNLYAGGLLVVVLVLLQGFLGLPSLDIWIFISMLASAVAIPPLSGVLVVNLVEKRFPYAHARSASAKAETRASIVGFVAALIAVATAFGHVSWVVMAVFVVSLLSTGVIYGWYVTELDDSM